MTHLSLFTGIGGLDLAAEWAGFETVGQCEWADYPTKILEKHWPDVARWRDIRTFTGESFYAKTGLRTVDILSGGFPCQPFSVAGKRRGADDDRYLWPEMLRVIKELRPAWIVGENVAGIVTMALDTVLSDLESIGYACEALIIPACAVDAPHRRDRCAIVGYSIEKRLQRRVAGRVDEKGRAAQAGQLADTGDVISHPDNRGGAVRRGGKLPEIIKEDAGGGNRYEGRVEEHGSGQRRPAEPGLGGMVDGVPRWMDEPLAVPRIAQGVPHRADRLKCLGNAVVPQQFYPIFKAIAEIEMSEKW